MAVTTRKSAVDSQATTPRLSSDGLTVPASYVRTLLATVTEQGHDAEALLVAESLTKEELAGATVPTALFGRIYQRAVQVLQDESLGLVSDGRIVRGTFRMMCLVLVTRPELGAIIQRAGEFLDVARGVVVKPDLHVESAVARVGFALTRGVEGRSLEAVLAEQDAVRLRTTLYLWHKLLGWFADRPLPLDEVTFAFPAPANGAAWARLFDCPIRFGAEASALVMPAPMLAWANVRNERALEIFLKSVPFELIRSAHTEPDMSERVLALFGDGVSRPLPSAAVAARQLGVSVSTLRRRLTMEGTSFRTLKDSSRQAAAIRFLAATDLSLADIAELLGYDEPSAFFRAFKRWTDMTPARYRADTRSGETHAGDKRGIIR